MSHVKIGYINLVEFFFVDEKPVKKTIAKITVALGEPEDYDDYGSWSKLLAAKIDGCDVSREDIAMVYATSFSQELDFSDRLDRALNKIWDGQSELDLA